MATHTSKQYFFKHTNLVTDNQDLIQDCQIALENHTILRFSKNFLDTRENIFNSHDDFCILTFSMDINEELQQNKLIKDFRHKTIKLCQDIIIGKSSIATKVAVHSFNKYITNEKYSLPLGILYANYCFSQKIPYIIIPRDAKDYGYMNGLLYTCILKKYVESSEQGKLNYFFPSEQPYEWLDIYSCLTERWEDILKGGGYKLYDFLR